MCASCQILQVLTESLCNGSVSKAYRYHQCAPACSTGVSTIPVSITQLSRIAKESWFWDHTDSVVLCITDVPVTRERWSDKWTVFWVQTYEIVILVDCKNGVYAMQLIRLTRRLDWSTWDGWKKGKNFNFRVKGSRKKIFIYIFYATSLACSPRVPCSWFVVIMLFGWQLGRSPYLYAS